MPCRELCGVGPVLEGFSECLVGKGRLTFSASGILEIGFLGFRDLGFRA